MRSRPACARASSGSYRTTDFPIAAWTWAMPWPINPAPATKTRPMGCAMASMVRGRPSPMRPTPGGDGPLRAIDLVEQPVRRGIRIEAVGGDLGDEGLGPARV